ncbi:MAG: hypothetical protein LAO31_10865 [Acidobacteriia bacterium]|nr:hypothetical protein [Terriglobia bacterium]
MKKKLLLPFLVATFLLGSSVSQLAQPAPSAGPPKVLLIEREEIKPGKGTVHEKEAHGFVQLAARAKSEAHWLGMSSISGNENEAVFLVSYPSFEALEKDRMKFEKAEGGALMADMEKLEAAGADMHASQRAILAVLRADLSYRLKDITADSIAHSRVVEIETFRVRLGHFGEFGEGAKLYFSAMEKANVNTPIALYQAISGAPGGTYFAISAMKSLKEMDVDNNKAVMAALGEENGKKLQTLERDSVMNIESNLYAISPRMSYVSKEMAGIDPGFWTPKPSAAPKAAAPATPAAKERAKQ